VTSTTFNHKFNRVAKYGKMDPCLKRYVKGVFASNTLPQILTKYPSAFIVNTQPLPMPGEHWMTIITHSPSQADFLTALENHRLLTI
jgi:hypothetical protein